MAEEFTVIVIEFIGAYVFVLLAILAPLSVPLFAIAALIHQLED